MEAPDVASGAVTSSSVNVIPPEVPVVFWLPAVLTPGRSIAALPLKETPPMYCAVVNVAADPVVFWFRVGKLLRLAALPVNVVASTVPVTLSLFVAEAAPPMPTLPVSSIVIRVVPFVVIRRE